jgi:outer membrane protein assembly factor BamB
MGAAMDSNQNVYVADYLNNRIQKWALNWSYQSPQTVAGQASGASGSGPSYLDDPTAVSLDAGGNVYALDQSNGRVQKWTAGATSGTTVAGSKIFEPHET